MCVRSGRKRLQPGRDEEEWIEIKTKGRKTKRKMNRAYERKNERSNDRNE